MTGSTRTINCHDCGQPVSLSARQCPQCGSKWLAGAYRSPFTIGYERRNDNFTVFVALIVFALCGTYGFEQGPNLASALLHTIIYGVGGLVVAIPIVFLINLIRGSR